MAKFLVADDHPLFREALVGALNPVFDNLEIVESFSLESTLAALSRNRDVELILLDLSMPGCENFYGLIRVTEDFPHIPVAVISASESAQVVANVMGLGAKGFIPKSSPTQLIAEAIRKILQGDTWLPGDMRKQVKHIGGEQRDIAKKISELTPKQFQVLKLLQDGMLNKQIAYKLNVTEATVKAHISAIFKKFGVNTRTQAVLLVEKIQQEL